MSEGWIKVHRKIKEWQHYQEPSVLLVFIDLLLSANAKDGWWKGKRVRRGEMFTSVSTISDSTGLDAKTVRKVLDKLEATGEIRREATNAGSKIIINQFGKFQSSGNNPQPNPQRSPQQTPQPNPQRIPYQQEINKERIIEEENIDDNPPTRVREEFSEIESTDTSSAQLVMMRQGWNAADYLNAVREFKATCAADGTHHDTPADAANHFRNWTAKRYTYGQRPLTPETPKPETDCDRAFSDWYRQKYGTEYVWQEDTTKAVQRIAAAIADKISEQGDISDPAQMPANIRAFLEAAHRLGDQWLNEHFNPQTLAKQFNEIYNSIKNGTTATTQPRKGRGNATGVSNDYLARIANDLAGDL
jgi:nucleoid DNA-binding protein